MPYALLYAQLYDALHHIDHVEWPSSDYQVLEAYTLEAQLALDQPLCCLVLEGEALRGQSLEAPLAKEQAGYQVLESLVLCGHALNDQFALEQASDCHALESPLSLDQAGDQVLEEALRGLASEEHPYTVHPHSRPARNSQLIKISIKLLTT